jgi:hypothetical protein
LELGTFVYGPLYAAVGLGLGGASLVGPTRETDGLRETPSGAMYVTGFGVAGVQVALGPLTLRADLAAGVRVVSLSFQSRYGSCEGRVNVLSARALLAPRAAVEVRVNPWTSLGFSGAVDALSPAAWNLGVHVRWSLRAYDGTSR